MKKSSGPSRTDYSQLETPAVGETAPDFELLDHEGQPIRLSALAGHPVVLFFYPAAGSEGCATQLSEVRDRQAHFDASGIHLLGISPDSVRRVANFRRKLGLSFPLLADPDHAVAEQYGVWAEKLMFGRRLMGVVRSSFVIDENGILTQKNISVPTKGHADVLLTDLSV